MDFSNSGTFGSIKILRLFLRIVLSLSEPSLYKDEYQVKLREIVEQKIAGKDITASASEVQVNVIDIMEALKQSLTQAGKLER